MPIQSATRLIYVSAIVLMMLFAGTEPFADALDQS